MSIELYEKIRVLEERVNALDGLVRTLMFALTPNVASPVMRKRPGPPKGYKRKPKELSA